MEERGSLLFFFRLNKYNRKSERVNLLFRKIICNYYSGINVNSLVFLLLALFSKLLKQISFCKIQIVNIYCTKNVFNACFNTIFCN